MSRPLARALMGVGLLLVLVLLPSSFALRFNQDGTFKILQLTDLHYGEGPHLDTQNDQVTAALLAAEQPDLVVLSGDMVSGYAWNGTQGWFAARWQQLMAPLEAAGIPYAAVLGNHDPEADLSRAGIVSLMQASSVLSLTKQGPAETVGATNYWLDIQPSLTKPQAGSLGTALGGPDGSRAGPDDSTAPDDMTDVGAEELENQVAARIWMLDSMSRGCNGQKGWGCVHPRTVAWAAAAARKLPPEPSIAFIHIPVPEFMTAWSTGAPASGSKGEAVCCPPVNTGAFAALHTAGVRAIYSGHDHDNNYVTLAEGVRLGLGAKTGYGSYGPMPGQMHGARVIVLQEGQSDTSMSETWIRLEDGQRQDQEPAPVAGRHMQARCAVGESYCIVEHPGARSCQEEEAQLAMEL